MRRLHLIAIVFYIGYCLGQVTNDLDVDELKNQFKDNIPGLENFNSSKLPTAEDLDRLLKEKCEKNGGGEEAFNALKDQQTQLQACIESQVNATEIQIEVEEAKKTGSMDEVFGKYCKKYPEIYKCFESGIERIKPCLDPQEQDTMNKSLVLLDELKEFICFKDGDRIAMFIAEGGVECLDSKKEELQACANKTLGSRIPTDMSVNSLPMFLFTDRECNDFDKIRTCFNDELEKCKDSTPANIVDAFFKFLKKHMPCDKVGGQPVSGEQKSPNSATYVTAPSLALGLALLLSKFL